MKKVTYLTALIVILAPFVLGCGQGAPNASSKNEVVPQIDAPIVSSEDESVPQLTHGVEGNPTGSCCPPGFVRVSEPGNPTDRNGDDWVCQMDTPSGTIIIDNNVPGNCDAPCIPPCGGGI